MQKNDVIKQSEGDIKQIELHIIYFVLTLTMCPISRGFEKSTCILPFYFLNKTIRNINSISTISCIQTSEH